MTDERAPDEPIAIVVQVTPRELAALPDEIALVRRHLAAPAALAVLERVLAVPLARELARQQREKAKAAAAARPSPASAIPKRRPSW